MMAVALAMRKNSNSFSRIRAPQYAVRRSTTMRRKMSGALHLDDGFPAVGENAAVHLRDGGGCEGDVVERREQCVDGMPQIGFDHPAGLLGGHRRHVVETSQTGVGQRGGEHAGRRRHQLPDLDERRAQHLETVDQALRRRVRKGAAATSDRPGDQR